MSKQEQIQPSSSKTEEVKSDGDAKGLSPERQAAVDAQVGITDDLLDEMDGVLETNAQEFVDNYVQKGGE
jgi:ubiquitin-like protein Pup